MATLGVLAAFSMFVAVPAHAEELTRTFNPTGSEQTFVVPAGVTTLHVQARGAHGAAGGAAAEVAADLSVSAGETLYIEVGGNGAGQAGGFNGGGEGGAEAQGGGGASDIRTAPRSDGLSPDTRVLVAGGGGGGSSNGLAGGAAGEEGESFRAMGGGPGTQTAGGEAGESSECLLLKEQPGKLTPGTDGSLGAGGNGASCTSKGSGVAGGGGGGGGYYGGGGGGSWFYYECPCKPDREGGGGGGGSSLVPAGGTLGLASASSEPVVELRFLANGSPPAAVTGVASEATQTTAKLNGSVNPNGGEVSECKLEYGLTNSYGASAACTPAPGSGTSPVAVSAMAAGLSANSTYHFRVVASNPGGTSYGSDETFKTAPNAPTVTTEAASEVTQTGARLNARVNPNGAEVSECKLEYGRTNSYGSSAPCTPAPGSGTSPVAVSASVGGLSEASVYHFRVSARNVSGTSYGSDGTFTTLATLSAPEFGRCLKVAAGRGGFSSSSCTVAQSGGAYEWFSAFGPEPVGRAGFSTAIKPTTKLLLEVKGGEKIYCTGQSGGGEYSGNKALANVTLTLTGCYRNIESDRCSNTATAGEVVTTTLAGSPGIVKEEAEAAKDKVGLRLAPSSGDVFAQFTCESVAVTVRGSVILQGKGNAMISKTTLKATQAKGAQKWTHFVGGQANEDILEVKIGAGSYAQAGLALSTNQTNEERVELNTIV